MDEELYGKSKESDMPEKGRTEENKPDGTKRSEPENGNPEGRVSPELSEASEGAETAGNEFREEWEPEGRGPEGSYSQSSPEKLRRQDVRRSNKAAGWLSLIGLLLYLFLSLALGAVGKNISFGTELLFSQLVILVPPLVYLFLFRKKHPEERLLEFRRIGFGNTVLLLLFAVCFYPVLSFTNLFSQLFVDNAISETISTASYSMPFWEMLLFVAVIPALVEETVYRGTYFGTWKRESVVWAAVFSGLLFGMMHMNFNQFAYAFVLGFVFALLDAALGSLHASMLIHCLYNSLSVCGIYLANDLLSFLGETEAATEAAEVLSDSASYRTLVLESLAGMLPSLLVGLVLSFFLYRLLAERCGTWNKLKDEFTGKGKGRAGRIVSLPLLVSFVLMLGLMILTESYN